MSRPFKFGDVVEWDIPNQRVIRWFIVGGEPGDYRGINVAIIDRHGKWNKLEHDRVEQLGVQGAHEGGIHGTGTDYRLLTDE